MVKYAHVDQTVGQLPRRETARFGEIMADTEVNPSGETPSAFPFRISASGLAPPVLTRIRNHSSYLTTGGPLNTLAAIAIYARGVIANFMIVLPVMIVVGIIAGSLHHPLSSGVLHFSKYPLVLLLLIVFWTFAGKTAGNLANFRSRQLRRSLSGLLLAVLFCTLLLEFTAYLVEYLRDKGLAQKLGPTEAFAGITSLAGGAGMVLKLFPQPNERRRKLIRIGLGLLSAVLLWAITTGIAYYVYYGIPPEGYWLWTPAICGLLLGLSVGRFAAMALSATFLPESSDNSKMLHRILRYGWQCLLTAALAIIPCGLSLFFMLFQVDRLRRLSDEAQDEIGVTSRPLSRMLGGLKGTDTTADLVTRLKNTKEGMDHEASLYQGYAPRFWGSAPLATEPPGSTKEANAAADQGFGLLRRWMKEYAAFVRDDLGKNTLLKPGYYREAQSLLEGVESFAALEPSVRAQLLDELGTSGPERIGRVIAERGGATKVEEVIQDYLLELIVRDFVRQDISIRFTEAELVMPLEGSMAAVDRLFDKHQKALRGRIEKERTPNSVVGPFTDQFLGKSDEKVPKSDSTAPASAKLGRLIFPSIDTLDRNKLRQWFGTSVVSQGIVEASPEVVLRIDPKLIADVSDGSRVPVESLGKISPAAFRRIVAVACRDDETLDYRGILSRVDEWFTAERRRLGGHTIDFVLANSEKSRGDAEEAENARAILIEIATLHDGQNIYAPLCREVLADIYDPRIPPLKTLPGESYEERERAAYQIYQRYPGLDFTEDELRRILATRLVFSFQQPAEKLIRQMALGNYANFEDLDHASYEVFKSSRQPKIELLLVVAVFFLVFSWLFLTPNSTSVHEYFRDQIARGFLVDIDGQGKSHFGYQVRLSEICRYDQTNSTAPYQLINTAMNVTTEDGKVITHRRAEPFVFSRLFVGSPFTGYADTERLEKCDNDFRLSSALAISAAAAAPNMGRFTNRLLTPLLTLLNFRLGYWLPHPEQVAATDAGKLHPDFANCNERDDCDCILCRERQEIRKRRLNVVQSEAQGDGSLPKNTAPGTFTDPKRPAFGVALSGGGIRSAALSLGILQEIDRCGLFPAIDYLSTVSGGGYIGGAITYILQSRAGVAETSSKQPTKKELLVQFARRWSHLPGLRCFIAEMFGILSIRSHWLNLSDGGHVENLGLLELLRRRCELVVVCDGEQDLNGHLDGLANAIRLAEIDLGIRVLFKTPIIAESTSPDVEAEDVARKVTGKGESPSTRRHFAIAAIEYPAKGSNDKPEKGLLLFLRSSLVGDEDVVIKNYKKTDPDFPHQSTIDQVFDETQFEAYRRLGEWMFRKSLEEVDFVGVKESVPGNYVTFRDTLRNYLLEIENAQRQERRSPQLKPASGKPADIQVTESAQSSGEVSPEPEVVRPTDDVD